MRKPPGYALLDKDELMEFNTVLKRYGAQLTEAEISKIKSSEHKKVRFNFNLPHN